MSLELLRELATRRAALLSAENKASPPSTNAFDAIVFRSQQMARVILDARKAALLPNPVLVLGESGTGKELLAKAIHMASTRAQRPWGVMNCGAIPRELLDSNCLVMQKEHLRERRQDRQGRFEACNSGTLLLDEVGDMPPETQVRLLRVLQEGEIQRVGDSRIRKVDVRIIAATNRDLVKEMGSGRFRDDLFYRIAVLVLRVPPLRERRDDIVPLAEYFLNRLNERARDLPGVERKTISSKGKIFAQEYSWPGNVRELENTLSRAFAMVSGDTLSAADLQNHVIPTSSPATPITNLTEAENFNLYKELEAVERKFVEQALLESGGVKERAARILGLRSRQALSHRMRKLGLGG